MTECWYTVGGVLQHGYITERRGEPHPNSLVRFDDGETLWVLDSHLLWTREQAIEACRDLAQLWAWQATKLEREATETITTRRVA